MSKRSIENPFQALENEAYDAFREWPIWLVLREKELAAHVTGRPVQPGGEASTRPNAAAPDGTQPLKSPRH
ncbi:MAG: hypothetical protein K8L97_08555 [Anaerolineae bacterium]|nr:hypothetical protein [Anaerolineae bacterium]